MTAANRLSIATAAASALHRIEQLLVPEGRRQVDAATALSIARSARTYIEAEAAQGAAAPPEPFPPHCVQCGTFMSDPPDLCSSTGNRQRCRAAQGAAVPPTVDALGLSDEQTRNLREHLAARQQTLGEWIGDVLFDMRLGRPDGIEYPPASGASTDSTEEERA